MSYSRRSCRRVKTSGLKIRRRRPICGAILGLKTRKALAQRVVAVRPMYRRRKTEIPSSNTPSTSYVIQSQLLQAWVIFEEATPRLCPLWVISGHKRADQGCPLYPPEADMEVAKPQVR